LPVVILIHGGFWRSSYGLDLEYPMAADLVARGYAVWNIEYRRVGEDDGGYPGTLTDVATAIDDRAQLVATYHLDLADVAVVGHSGGGHLAMWSASRGALPDGAPWASPIMMARLAIGQGPVVDLIAADKAHLGGGATSDFIGGPYKQYPDRYAIAGPSIKTSARLIVVRGALDGTVPAEFTLPKVHAGVKIVDVPGNDHFDLIDPNTSAWKAVVAELVALRSSTSSDERLCEQSEGCDGEGDHVVAAIAETGQHLPARFDRPGDGRPRVAGRVAVAVRRAGSTSFAEAPRRAEAGRNRPGEICGEDVRRTAHPLRRLDRTGHPRPTGSCGVDHRSAEVVRRSSGYRQQRGGNQTSRRAFGDTDGFPPLVQQRSDASGEICQLLGEHALSMSDRSSAAPHRRSGDG